MPRRATTEDALRGLNAVRGDPLAEDSQALLATALVHKSNHVVAKAASLIEELDLPGHAPAMNERLLALLDADAASDPGCAGKTALAHALARSGGIAETALLRGIRHRQIEPSFGGSVDTAAQLRAACGLALAGDGHVDAPRLLADLLADPEPVARVGAARAIGLLTADTAAPLLRYAYWRRDAEPQVIGEVLAALLQVDGEAALDVVRDALRRSSLQQAAALAIGEARCAAACPDLIELSARARDPHTRRTAILSLGMLRAAPARAHLLELLGSAPRADAELAIEGLTLDPAARAEAEAAVARRAASGGDDVGDALARAFD